MPGADFDMRRERRWERTLDTAERRGGAIAGDKRPQFGQNRAVDVLECLKKHGQRLDSEIAEETGVALATVHERLDLLARSGAVIACKLTRFENGIAVDALLYRASGYYPPLAPGRKPKAPS
jgi:hypothetical protein